MPPFLVDYSTCFFSSSEIFDFFPALDLNSSSSNHGVFRGAPGLVRGRDAVGVSGIGVSLGLLVGKPDEDLKRKQFVKLLNNYNC